MTSAGEETETKVYFRLKDESRVRHVKVSAGVATDAKAVAAAITAALRLDSCTLFAAGEAGDQVESDEELVSSKESPVTVEVRGSCTDGVCQHAPRLTAVCLVLSSLS
jgi:hypothetical protein